MNGPSESQELQKLTYLLLKRLFEVICHERDRAGNFQGENLEIKPYQEPSLKKEIQQVDYSTEGGTV